jgi:HK97 family phage prohead protease
MADETPSPDGSDSVRDEQVLNAAEHGDRLAFAALAQRLGSLERAQEIVRKDAFVRMADRVGTLNAPRLQIRDTKRDDNASESDGPTLFGHFAVFHEWTEVDSVFEGHFMERIAPGAFKKTLSENRDGMRVLFQHGHDPTIGNKPLGTIDELHEDDVGAYYETSLLDAPYVREDILPGLKAGLYGASFRFRTIREEFETEPDPSDTNPKGLPERTLKELQVSEFSPVTFPAYASATAGVRGANGDGAEEDVPVAPSDPDAALSTSENERRDHPSNLYGMGREEERPSWHL